ncbi:hypothetical protein HKCCE3408_14720 [Rhodobacterales bacterium HKCCE3408]|nr:hypothetical protein [Rhodobacterales bacterium HKCCE3408]
MDSPIDVTIVCGARPALLERTLNSFANRLFANFEIGQVFANLDLFNGTEAERAACRDLLHAHFERVDCRLTETPGFAEAVRWLWSQPKAEIALHLEDDWLLNCDVRPGDILPLFSGNTGQVSFQALEKHWKYRSRYHTRRRRLRIPGIGSISWPDPSRPFFTTAPSFVTRHFANGCSERFDTTRDPEKQMSDGSNPTLSAFTRQFRNRLWGGRNPYPITDIGRDWRAAQGIEKSIVGGRSSWTSA